MSLLTVVLVLVVCGLLVGLVYWLPWLPAGFKTAIYVVVVLALIVWMAGVLGLTHYLDTVHVGPPSGGKH